MTWQGVVIVVLLVVVVALAVGVVHYDLATLPFGRTKFIPAFRLGSCDARVQEAARNSAEAYQQILDARAAGPGPLAGVLRRP